MISQSISPQVIHLVAGGCGGTVGAVITCPLEVVKTRLQSSKASIKFLPTPNINADGAVTHVSRRSLGVFQSLKTICIEEGGSALFRGLGPNLVGIAPSRAIYFGAYASAKNFLNTKLEPESSMVHLLSAASGGFISSTCTNPIWLIKTRLQLEHRNGKRYTNTWRAIKTVYSHEGLRGFYRGVTASYVGISETMIHFVIYERIKKFLREQRAYNSDLLSPKDFLTFMGAAATSKSIAATIAYPHEVARTRLREEGTKYRTFFQTLSTVLREEGFRGCYGGLVAHLARQIPNTAIVLVVYELVVYSLNKL
ncbi:solute carrier family 25 member 36-A-like [Apostichopus japonicus]|uniref:solute carrier family 25 member 36-A-like n=1 Tax=Stichopus japonicus TaxID=307972 RepID=UPI003AB6F707